MFTLLIGLLVIAIIKNSSNNWIVAIPIILGGAFISYICMVDGSYYGIGLISVFYLFYNRMYCKYIISIIFMFVCGLDFLICGLFDGYFLTAVFSILLISLYNGKRGVNLKYFFYIFYPGHLLGLYLVALWIGCLFQ